MTIQKSKLTLTALALSLTGLISTGVQAIETTDGESYPMVKIGDKVDFALDLGGKDSKNQLNATGQMEIFRPGASFIKLHFSQFQLPTGATMIISNPSGTELYRYGADANNRDGVTFDLKSGDDGLKRFSPMSISGSRLKLRLIDANGRPLKKGHRIIVDYITQGFSHGLEQVETIDKLSGEKRLLDTCGASTNRKDIKCYEGSNPKEYDRSRPVARLITHKGGSTYTCTAWRVGENNHMLTNNHCVQDQNEVNNSELWFNYHNTQCGGSTLSNITKITPSTLLKTNEALDYSLITVNNFSTIASWGHFGLETRKPAEGERIYIPQHGAGRPKELSIESQMTNTGLCEIKYKDMSNYQAGYQCDTTGGSSGSPVLAANTDTLADDRVVALHHWGGCKSSNFENVNRGVQISNIWPEIKGFFNNVVPKGDNEGPVDPDPTDDLQNGSTVNGIAAGKGDWRYYQFSLEQAASNVSVTISGGSGDADLYVNKGSKPTLSNFTCRPWKNGNSEQCTFNQLDSGQYHVGLNGYDAFSNVSLSLSYDSATGGGDIFESNLSGASKTWQHYTLEVPNGATSLNAATTGSSGDADLYIRHGSKPTESSYDCSSTSSDSNEQCNLSNPQAGTWYISVFAWSAYSGLTLKTETK